MSIRLKLVIGLFAIIFIFNLILALLTSWYVGKVYFREVQTRVRMDLNSARDIYQNSIDRIREILHAISIRRSIPVPLAREAEGELGTVLSTVYRDMGMDILTLTDSKGLVLFRAHNPGSKGDDLSTLPILQKVLKTGKSAGGTVVLSEKALLNESPELARRARIELVDTPRSRPLEQKVTDRGMLIAAAVPFRTLDIPGTNTSHSAVLLGAVLLNNNFGIVDKIKSELFRDQQYQGKDIGTATIFLDDVRISTNGRGAEQQRAVGSRMSREVYDRVIRDGAIWARKAFVVSNWFITAYEPILNPDSRVIGALYVGLLEKPFTQPQKVILLFFLLGVAGSVCCSFVLVFFYTRKLLKPIDQILCMSKRVINGDLTARCRLQIPGEMGTLCRSLDQMADTIQQREEELKRVTREQITQSDKLASIGRLSAGIAHEINNPLTGVLTFAHLLQEKKNNSPQDLRDLGVIIRETTRVRDIVRGLLDFARQSPFEKQVLSVNDLISQILQLIRNQKEFKGITVNRDFQADLPPIHGDRNQLQQVFLNLILNAAEAIPGRGTIFIQTRLEMEGVTITIRDTGCGIKKRDLEKIFDPFYTTKPVGKGTGLGLSITYGIIEQHQGTIRCESTWGEGTTFTIVIPPSGAVRKESAREPAR